MIRQTEIDPETDPQTNMLKVVFQVGEEKVD